MVADSKFEIFYKIKLLYTNEKYRKTIRILFK